MANNVDANKEVSKRPRHDYSKYDAKLCYKTSLESIEANENKFNLLKQLIELTYTVPQAFE